MDEVEDPSLPRAGEASPTIRPISGDDSPPKDTVESDEVLAHQIALPSSPNRVQLPARPQLKRESSAPAPPQQPPPPAPSDSNGDAVDDAPDSLTLADLKRIRSTFPVNQPPPEKPQVVDFDRVYDFEYLDAQSLPVEIEEWFSYSDAELSRVRQCKLAFNEEWRVEAGQERDWIDVTEDVRRQFVSKKLEILGTTDRQDEAISALQVLTYIGLGVWDETAGRQDDNVLEELFPGGDRGGSRLNEYNTSGRQIQWIVAMVDTLHACDGLQVIYSVLQNVARRDFETNAATFEASMRNESQVRLPNESVELWCCLTLLYLFVEVARATQGESARKLRRDIAALEPTLLNYLTKTIALLRWEEALPIPLTKMLLLSWKTILATIGGIKDVEHVKSTLREAEAGDQTDARGKPIITASPLDYHLFRQEINSKYPAYQPPPSLFPLEPENNSILPPLKNRRSSYASTIDTSLANAAPTSSIMHQPVHIATPAPSPPPSPAGPGKTGKKQNYQTNQMFPFLYPPLDGTSNDLGGKGNTELQDLLVGRKWEGSDIPASIMEAAELFSKRMHATRAMKQLWQVRVEYMKQERGWKNEEDQKEKQENSWLGKSLKVLEELRELGIDGLEGLEDLDLDEDDGEDDFEVIDKPATSVDKTAEQGEPMKPKTDEQRCLDEVENFYKHSLQHLQSVVIVLLKTVLQNVTDLVTKNNGQNGLGLQAGIQFNDAGVNGINGLARPIENGNGPLDSSPESTAEELDQLRVQEIGAKALSAILLLLLKWFKTNHILQYEYMSQLMMDSNYVPLMLKSWQTQDVGRACHYRLEREELNFFAFCRENSQPPSSDAKSNGDQFGTADSSEDEACPPPIKLKRSSSLDAHPLSTSSTSPYNPAYPPEIDELGYPTTPLPSTPITHYSYRNTFANINFIRILQKLTRRKTQRALMLINYKSSNHLKKSLKVPIHLLRYYTLKVFKSQVPFCGRKWRQGNMKIITAVWLSVPAELRDDWLAGGGGGMGGGGYGDVDGAAEDAVPMEQALRALTHWWNMQGYKEEMGWGKGLGGEEMGFFERELERMGLLEEEGTGQEMVLEEPPTAGHWGGGGIGGEGYPGMG